MDDSTCFPGTSRSRNPAFSTRSHVYGLPTTHCLKSRPFSAYLTEKRPFYLFGPFWSPIIRARPSSGPQWTGLISQTHRTLEQHTGCVSSRDIDVSIHGLKISMDVSTCFQGSFRIRNHVFSTGPNVCNIPACQGTTLLPKSKNFDFIFLKILSSPPQIFSKYVSSIQNWLYNTSGHITSIFEPFTGSFGQNCKIGKCFHFEESSTVRSTYRQAQLNYAI